MTISRKDIVAMIASTAAACCLTACAREPEAPGGTTDYTNRTAPKTIHSKNITSFSFFAETMGMMDTVPSRGNYFVSVQKRGGFPGMDSCRFNLDRKGEQAEFKVSCGQMHGQQTFKAEGITDKSALDRLQDIIDEYKVAQLNGFYKRNSALGNSFSLKVKYDSDETISAGAEGGAAVSPNTYLPREEFNSFFHELVEQSGQKIPGSLPSADKMTGFSIRFTNFHGATSFPEGRYKMGYQEFGQRRGAYLYYGAGKDTKSIFSEKITKQEADELKAFIQKSNLKNLSGYQLDTPEKGDHQFAWEITYKDSTRLYADAVGDESVLPGRYWEDNGRTYVEYFQKLMQKYGKEFPGK